MEDVGGRRGRGIMGTELLGMWGGERALSTEVLIREDWNDETMLDWRLEREFSSSLMGKSEMEAMIGNRHGSGEPAM